MHSGANGQQPQQYGFLKKIEIVGNKLPNPAILFLIMLALLAALSVVLSLLQVSAVDPITKKTIYVKSLSVRKVYTGS